MPFEPRETGAAPPELDAASVATYLAKRGLIDDAGQVTTQPLGGGISNIVLAVSAEDRTLVVKQSLPRLRVTDEWLASPVRILSEADALTLCARLTPGAVPARCSAATRSAWSLSSSAPRRTGGTGRRSCTHPAQSQPPRRHPRALARQPDHPLRARLTLRRTCCVEIRANCRLEPIDRSLWLFQRLALRAPRAACCPARSGWSWTVQLAAGDHRAARVCRILSTACTKSASWLEVRARLSAIYPRGAM